MFDSRIFDGIIWDRKYIMTSTEEDIMNFEKVEEDKIDRMDIDIEKM